MPPSITTTACSDFSVQHGAARRLQIGLGKQMGDIDCIKLVLLTTAAASSYLEHSFQDDQILLFGRESAGVPESVHNAADARLCIPMRRELRSLNIAVAVAMVTGEALRQTGGLAALPK